ncbi:MAG: ABC transporter substrate-binding protein [Anaerolineae bacterium]
MTRHILWQVLLIVIGVVLVGILLVYLAINYTTVLRPGRGGTYVEGIAGFPHYLNPLLSSSQVDHDICALVFGGLTRLNEHGEVEPDLARGWDVTLDGLVYTFHLRSNVYWHDGTPFTADDVVFTIGLLQAPDFPGPSDLGPDLWQTVTVEKVDRRTVRFTLPEPYAPFLDYTTVGILPVHLLGGIRAAALPNVEFNLNPVGTGPFQLEEIEVEGETIATMVLKRHARYYGARPYLDRIQFRFYPSDRAVFDAYEAGEVEGIARVPAADLARAGALPNLALFSAQIARYGIVFLNLGRPDLPFFQEQEVRQALLYALDRQRIVESALGGQALVVHSPLIPGTWAYDDNVPHYEYDPDAASELLDEAGWELPPGSGGVRRKGGQQLAFTLLTSSEPERFAVAQMLARQWATVGVTVTVETASPLEVREALENRDFEAILVHLALPGDPDPYPFWHETQVENGQNYAGFAHRRISEVIEQARVTVNRERRLKLYYEFQDTFAQEVPALLLYVPIYTYGVDERIHNVQIGPLMHASDRFRTISEWWIVPRRVFVSEAEAGD